MVVIRTKTNGVKYIEKQRPEFLKPLYPCGNEMGMHFTSRKSVQKNRSFPSRLDIGRVKKRCISGSRFRSEEKNLVKKTFKKEIENKSN